MANKNRTRYDASKRGVDAQGTLLSTEKSMLLMEDVFPKLKNLPSHSFEITDATQSSPTEVPVPEYDYNSHTTRVRRYDSSRKFTEKRAVQIGLPPFESDLEELAFAGERRDFFVLFNDSDYNNRRVDVSIPANGMDEPNNTGKLKMGGTDPQAELISKVVGYTEAGMMKNKAISARPTTSPTANPLYAAVWLAIDADRDASASPGDVLIGGGQIGDAVDEVLSKLTTNISRFDTENDVTTSLAAGSLITSMVRVGTKIVATYANHIDPANVGATAGGVVVYDNGTVTEALLSAASLATPMYGVAYDKDGDRIVAVGKGGKIVTASIIDLTTLVDISMGTTPNLFDIAFGESGLGYIVDVTGGAYSITGTTTLDVSSDVKGSLTPTTLVRVAYLGNEHYAIGGDTGFFSETLDGGINWTPQALNSGAGTVYAISGHTWRTLISIDGDLFERSTLTIVGDEPNYEMAWRELTLLGNAALSGNIRDIELQNWLKGYNVLVAVTDAGEVVYGNAVTSSY